MGSNLNTPKVRNGNRVPVWRSGKYWTLLMALFVISCLAVVIIMQQPALNPGQYGTEGKVPKEADKLAEQSPVRTNKEIVDFHMKDLKSGWIQYADSTAVTQDGGAHWTEAAKDQLTEAEAEDESIQTPGVKPGPNTISYKLKPYTVKKSQFLTDRAGWVLAADESGVQAPLLVTLDGGATWHEQVTPELTAALDAEQKRLQSLQLEASYYLTNEAAQKAIQSAWTLLPAVASPGDAVLVRHKDKGEVKWQGKSYPLQPFGFGYFTYLPVPMDVKPGQYPVGDQVLTIKAKKFETQYLKVTKQMESMRQETGRIQADQKKIDAARRQSQPEFLFSSNFIQPVEGVLTTPFGYTRYVNGKLDSSHRAIDLAAKEGTPIQATNDGVVALADSLYLTGNSIYIDHGMGLFSQYAHLSELRVKTGDKVKKGDIIGLVGTTGFSTGPHLHFTFWAHNVPVNPNLFFNSTPFQWTAAKEANP